MESHCDEPSQNSPPIEEVSKNCDVADNSDMNSPKNIELEKSGEAVPGPTAESNEIVSADDQIEVGASPKTNTLAVRDADEISGQTNNAVETQSRAEDDNKPTVSSDTVPEPMECDTINSDSGNTEQIDDQPTPIEEMEDNSEIDNQEADNSSIEECGRLKQSNVNHCETEKEDNSEIETENYTLATVNNDTAIEQNKSTASEPREYNSKLHMEEEANSSVSDEKATTAEKEGSIGEVAEAGEQAETLDDHTEEAGEQPEVAEEGAKEQSQGVADEHTEETGEQPGVAEDYTEGGDEEDGKRSEEAEEEGIAEEVEDGELSDEEDNDGEITSSADGGNTAAESIGEASVSATSSSTDHRSSLMSPPAVPTKRSRKSTESSEEPGEKTKENDSSESSSSEEEESRSERKRRKKEKERRKKEKKQKRKREKQERKMRKRQKLNEEMDSGGRESDRPDYPAYSDRWGDVVDSQSRRYDDYPGVGGYGAGRRPSPSAQYDSAAMDPYASPPDDSSEDEFSESLYSLVGDELMDPNVSAAEKEALFKKSKDRIPGLSAGKLKKIMRNRQFREQQVRRQRDRERRRDRHGGSDSHRDKFQKCRYYAEGKCQKGERCQFSHNFIPAKKMEACKFFLQGYCAKGDMCIYLHSEVPCKYYHTGQKCFNAEKCKFSHEPLTDSTKPLLEKAILLEETGTFKSDRPSLLGTPPKDRKNGGDPDSRDERGGDPRRMKFDTDRDDHSGGNKDGEDVRGHRLSSHIPSILDLNITPSLDMQQKLDLGLYEELTAPMTDSEEERFKSPPRRPTSFYSDTLATPNRPDSQSFNSEDQGLHSPNTRRNRWGPDLPNQQSHDNYNNYQQDYQHHNGGGGDADRVVPKKGPLLPIPGKASPFSNSGAPNQSPGGGPPDVATSTAQAAAVNLSKILNALRSNAVTATRVDPWAGVDPRASADPRAADPRAAALDLRAAAIDPRAAAIDPRAAAIDPRATAVDPRAAAVDPRAAAIDPRAAAVDPRARTLLPDPRSQAVEATAPRLPSYDPRMVGSAAAVPVKPPPPAPVRRVVPELDGKYTTPVTFKLIPVYVEVRTSFLPPGAETSQEMLRDPRIKKRVLSMKKAAPALPSLPDITADLQRIQNARLMASSAGAISPRISNRASIDSISSEPRLGSTERRLSNKGHGDQNSLVESIIENGTKPRNSTRTSLSKVNPNPPASLYTNNNAHHTNSFDDEEEEDNSLTIDMPEDESRNTRTAEAVYT